MSTPEANNVPKLGIRCEGLETICYTKTGNRYVLRLSEDAQGNAMPVWVRAKEPMREIFTGRAGDPSVATDSVYAAKCDETKAFLTKLVLLCKRHFSTTVADMKEALKRRKP